MTMRRGFSLIEVLIAVVALALGLLGLAAVFPVVVTQQRDASDRTIAVSASKSLEAELASRADLSNRVIGWSGFREFVDAFDNGPDDDDSSTPTYSSPDDGDWINPLRDTSSAFGAISWPDVTDDAAVDDLVIPIDQRLVPAPGFGQAPRFVWDITGREITRLDEATGSWLPTGGVMVAVFLRRVDPAIRMREDLNDDDRIDGDDVVRAFEDGDLSPVAVSSDGVPTLNGRAPGGGYSYGEPAMLRQVAPTSFRDPSQAADDAADADALLVFRPSRAERAALAQVGQRLVDRHGNVYRVTAVKSAGDDLVLRTDPAVGAVVREQADGMSGYTAADIAPLVYVPQTPVEDPIILGITR